MLELRWREGSSYHPHVEPAAPARLAGGGAHDPEWVRPSPRGPSPIGAGALHPVPGEAVNDAPAPVAQSQRIVSLDVLRGFALLGILL